MVERPAVNRKVAGSSPASGANFYYPMTYIAFLRGINVGGNTLIKMADLKRVLTRLGLKKLETVLASGNVIFETPETDVALLTHNIQQKLKSHFDLNVTIVLRTANQIESLIKADPFKKVKSTPQTRLLVTFLPEAAAQHGKLGSAADHFGILKLSNHEICSAFEVAEKRGTTDLMKVLEKVYGKKITTRTWNTVQRIANLIAAEVPSR
jgi:uncharacterized protein (DUF1697 family)